MTRTIKWKSGVNVRAGISSRLILCLLLILTLAVVCVGALLVLNKVRLYEQHEIAVKSCTNHLLDRIEEALSLSADWPDKDKYIIALKTGRELYEYLQYTIGPLEIRENETFDKASRVVVPNLSLKMKERSTGKIISLPKQDGPNIADTILEERETAEGSRWYIITGKEYIEMESWLKLPRKKVAKSPTIILKKAVAIQVVVDNEVISERIVYWDE